MAIEVATAYVSIVPSAQNFTKKLQSQVNGQSIGDQLGKSIGDGMDKSFMHAVRNIRATLLTAIGIKEIAQAVGGAIGGAFKVGADFERTQVAFTGLLGNAELANDELAKLQEFGKITPFKFTGLAEDAKKLLAYGFSVDQLIPTLTKLGDATAALGGTDQDINLVTRALGQMIGKGRVQLEEINQIAEALPGFNPIPALARSVNASEADFQKALSSPGGALTAFGLTGKQAVDVIINAMGDIPGAAGAMDRISHTLSGATANVADSMDILRINATKPLQPVITEFLLNKVIPAMQVASVKVPKYSQKVADWLAKLFEKFDKRPTNPKLIPFLKTVAKDLKLTFEAIFFILKLAGENWAALINGIFGRNQQAFQFKNPLADIHAVVGSAIGDLLKFLGDVIEKVRPLMQAFLDEWDKVGGNTTIAKGFKDIGDALQPLLDMVSTFAGDKTGDFLRGLGDPANVTAMQKLADTLNGGIKTAFDDVIPKIQDFVKFVKDNPDAFAAAAAGFATFAAATLTMATAVAAVGKAQTILTSVTSGLSTLGAALAPLGVAGVVVAVILALAAAFVVAYLKIKPFHDFVDATGRFLQRVFLTVMSALRTAVIKVGDGFDKLKSGLSPLRGFFVHLGVLVVAFRRFLSILGAEFLYVAGVVKRFFVRAFEAIPGIIGAVVRFLGRAVDFLARVGNALIGPFQAFVGWLRAHFFNTVGAILEFVVALASKGIEILRPFFGFMVDLIKRLIQVAKVIGKALSETIGTAIRILIPIIKFLATAFMEWFKILKAQLAILLPIWEFVWKTVRDIVVSVFKTVKSIITRGLDFIRGIFHIATGLIKGDWKKVWTGVKEVVGSIFGAITDQLKNSWNLIWKVISNIPFGRLASTFINLGKTILGAAWTLLKALVKLAITEAPILLKAFWNWLTLGFRLAIKLIPIIAGVVKDFLGRLVQLAAAMMPVVLKQLLRLGLHILKWVIGIIPSLLKGLGLLFVALLVYLAYWLPKLTFEIGVWVLKAIPKLLVNLAKWGAAFVKWLVGTGLPWIAEKAAGLLTALVGWLKEAIPELLAKLVEWGGALVDWIVNTGVPWLVDKVKELAGAIVNWITDSLPDLLTKLAEWGKSLLDWITNTGIPWITGKAGELKDAILGWVTDAIGAIPGLLESFGGKIVEWVGKIPGLIEGAAGDIWGFIGSAFFGMLNGVIDAWNKLDLKITIPDIWGVPHRGESFDLIPDIPNVHQQGNTTPLVKSGRAFADGGVFTKPWSGFAQIAETGRAQPEILTPHKLLTETFRAEIKRAGGTGDGVGGRHMTIENLNVLNPHKSNATEIADAVEAKLAFALTTRGDR